MTQVREVKLTLKSKPTLEGAGVNLKRAFAYDDPLLDPFLLLDDFHSDNPLDYLKGFPWHPHRGIETITYVLYGKIEHGDSMKNKGVIKAGDVQWMTAGSGIVHQEMPKKISDRDTLLWGFQLWANLPSSHKMMDPRYRDVIKEQIPEVRINNGKIIVKIICGTVNGVKGPVQDIVTEPEYLDVTVNPNTEFERTIKKEHNVFAYVIDGEGFFDLNRNNLIKRENLVLYREGDSIHISTKNEKVRFLLISGKPIREPVAWYGPIVMNTDEEIKIAFEEYEKGTFIKHK